MRRAQAAVEYLTTYGWALLIVAIVAAIIFYFMQPQPVQLCTFQTQEFSCYTYKLTSNTGGKSGIVLFLYSTKSDVKVTGFNCTTAQEWTLSDFQNPDSNVTIARNEYESLSGNLTDPLPLPCWKADGSTINNVDFGQQYRGKLYVQYVDLETNTEHKAVGDVAGRVE